MTVFTKLFSQQELLLFNQEPQDLVTNTEPFALADLLTAQIDQNKAPMLHFWESRPTVILGMKDTRVPQLANGLNLLKHHDYHYLARNSGGLAVVSDRGILNVSLIIPNSDAEPLTITAAYEVMFNLIQEAFADFPVIIEAKEITDSYCPGEFDLSINDLKFAGIAQRRIRNGIAVMIYLSVNGPQRARGELIREFYSTSLGENVEQQGYPVVNPNSMANLADLLQMPLTVADVKNRLLAVFTSNYQAILRPTAIHSYIETNQLETVYQKNIAKMARRNEDIYQIGGKTT